MNKFLQMLSLCAKAGKIVSGEFAVEQAIRKREVLLAIVAEDASDNTRKHFTDMCAYRDIPILVACSKTQLGKYTGKQERASIGVLDRGFAEKLLTYLQEV